MLRLQQYEHLMKALLAHHELAGPARTLERQLATRVEKFADKTLGTLVKSLFETYVVPDGYERELLPVGEVPTDHTALAVSHCITMEPQRLAKTRAAIEELVVMRNQLVHHFIQKFDLCSDAGCTAALEHLEHCYERIELHHCELLAWAQGMEKARAMMAAFAATEAFHDMVVNGIAPDGSFSWPFSGIVSVLRQAATELSEDGWARLERAQAWIEADHAEQTPAKYGCRTWPQVLSESRMFDLEYRGSDDGRKVAWFRVRSGM